MFYAVERNFKKSIETVRAFVTMADRDAWVSRGPNKKWVGWEHKSREVLSVSDMRVELGKKYADQLMYDAYTLTESLR